MTGLYSHKRWRALREKKLAKNPVCQVCGSYQDLEIHHRDPVTKQQLEDNDEAAIFPPISKLTTLCESCHSKVTSKTPERELTIRSQWDRFLAGE